MEITINIDGQALSVEVTVEVYEYLDRADHKEENLAHEKRRHWDSREFDEYIVLTEGRSCYYQTPEQWVCRKETMLEIKAALALCTEAQYRRFLLYALEGLSYAQIAGLCRCSKAAIQDSIEAVRKKINLKKYYYPLFVADTLIEVSDEVAEALLLMRREENNRTRKIWYHKAYYSLDCEDGIENRAFDFTAKSPEEILLEQEEEQLFLATLEHLSEAMNSLTDIQARRIHARYILGKKLIEIAAEEGVSVSVVQQTVKSGLKRMRNYFEKKKWRE